MVIIIIITIIMVMMMIIIIITMIIIIIIIITMVIIIIIIIINYLECYKIIVFIMQWKLLCRCIRSFLQLISASWSLRKRKARI